MGFAKTRLAAANPAVTNRFVTSTNMVNAAYTVANATMPTPGARRLTATITGVTGNDTPGVLTVVGTNLRGDAQTEVITLVAGGSATGTLPFLTVTSITGSGWTINGGNDTIVVGCEAGATVLAGAGGTLHAVVVNTTAAGTVTLADAGGAFAVLKASIVEGTYYYDVDVGFLQVTLAAASDVTIVHTSN